MKHCHFSIVYNEYPFLVQKLPFLYDNFDQLIFYYLNITTRPYSFSTDGSHEYIKNYKDPDKKIIFIENPDIGNISCSSIGASMVGKRQMFIEGSKYVRDDIDVFWCTDMDEFFERSLIKEVENIFEESSNFQSINYRHFVFWKNENFIFCDEDKHSCEMSVRICRHSPGNIYGHCTLKSQYFPVYSIDGDRCWHFSYVGKERVKFKMKCHNTGGKKYINEILNNFDESLIGNDICNYPNMHPNPSCPRGVKKYNGKFPDYIDVSLMMKMIKEYDIFFKKDYDFND